MKLIQKEWEIAQWLEHRRALTGLNTFDYRYSWCTVVTEEDQLLILARWQRMGVIKLLKKLRGHTQVRLDEKVWSIFYGQIQQQYVGLGQSQQSGNILFVLQYNNQRISVKNVRLGEEYIFAKPHFGTTIDSLIQLGINERPNIAITRNDPKLESIRPFTGIVSDLGFKGILRKIFVSVSKDRIRFKTRINSIDLGLAGITEDQLTARLKRIKS